VTIIDAWMQHPSAQCLAEPMFDSLRRWSRGRLGADGELPAEATVAAMDAAGVRTGMLCGWWGPRGPLIYLDTVALEFPELVIAGGHIGYPWTAEMISLATKYPNVYIDTSACKASRYPRELVDFGL
jgi:Amidohydrolase